MHREMMIQKRNLMIKIRQNDSEFKKYDLMNDNYDMELVEKKQKAGADKKYQEREDKR
jgi:hypothetical protein